MKRAFLNFCFWLFGWKTSGEAPEIKKYVLIVAPHTSNVDFFVGVAARAILRIRSSYLAKHTLFKIPLIGWFLRVTGGFPVDRSRNTRLVDQVVELFDRKDEFIITVTPEGTRSYNPRWKTGFYWIAQKANVPIVMVGFDYGKKTVEIKEPFYPTGDVEKDIGHIKAYYRTVKGKFPEKGVR